MKRDMVLIREIMLAIEARQDKKLRPLEIDGHEALVVAHHVEMLLKAKLIEGRASSREPNRFDINDLTWEGHDFLTTLRNEKVWAKLKQSFSAAELASIPLAVIKDLGIGLLTQWAKNQVGLGG